MNINKIAYLILTTVSDAGNRGVPSGHIYAAIMQHVNIDDYQRALGALVKVELLKQNNFLLTATEKGHRVAAEMIAAMK